MRSGSAMLAMLMLTATVLAQPRTAVNVVGRVVRADDGAPLPNARVTSGNDGQSSERRQVLTDVDGRFTMTVPRLPAQLSVHKTGYGPQVLDVSTGELVIRLAATAVIAGRVVNDRGDPIVGVRVFAEDVSRAQNATAVVAQADTDDLGEYRLSGLPANGRLAVSVVTVGTAPADAPGSAAGVPLPFFRTYYPDTTDRGQAQVLVAVPGEVSDRIDLVIPVTRSARQPFSVDQRVPFVPPGLRRSPPGGAAPTGRLRGRVSATDGRALPGARVLALGPNTRLGVEVVEADAQGLFVIANLPAGDYHVMASKPGYSPVEAADAVSPASAVPGSAVSIRADDVVDNIDIRLAPWSTIAGIVRDEYGDPIQGAAVQLWQIRYALGRRQLTAAGPAARLTDDRGLYRLFGVPPGAYLVTASVRDPRTADWPGYALTYYPGTIGPSDAQFVSVAVSSRVTNVDIDLQPTPTFRVAGLMRNAAGEPTMGGMVRLFTSQGTRTIDASFDARVTPDGHFEFAHVPPGPYVMQTQQSNRGGAIEGEFGVLAVTVADTDVVDLQVQATRGSIVSGHLVLDRRPAAVDLSRVRIRAIPTDVDRAPPGGWATADVEATGAFSLGGLHGSRRFAVETLPGGWTLQAIRVAGVDVTDRPLPFGRDEQSLTDVEIVLSDRLTTLSGTALDRDRKPSPNARVVIFSVDRDRWFPESRYLRVVTTSPDGAFETEGLPAGAYFVAAVSTLPAEGVDAWQDPAWLEAQLGHVVGVTLSEGEVRSLRLTIDGAAQ